MGGGQRKKKPRLAHADRCRRKFFFYYYFFTQFGDNRRRITGGPLSDGGSKAKRHRAHSLRRRVHYHRRHLSRAYSGRLFCHKCYVPVSLLGKLRAFPIWQIGCSRGGPKNWFYFLRLRVQFFTKNRSKSCSRGGGEFHIKIPLTRVWVFFPRRSANIRNIDALPLHGSVKPWRFVIVPCTETGSTCVKKKFLLRENHNLMTTTIEESSHI